MVVVLINKILPVSVLCGCSTIILMKICYCMFLEQGHSQYVKLLQQTTINQSTVLLRLRITNECIVADY